VKAEVSACERRFAWNDQVHAPGSFWRSKDGGHSGLPRVTFESATMNESDIEGPVVWELRRGQTLFATIDVSFQDFPWMSGAFTATESFEPFRHLFLVNRDRAASEAARAEIQRQGIVLSPSGGSAVQSFILQVDGSEAGFKFH